MLCVYRIYRKLITCSEKCKIKSEDLHGVREKCYACVYNCLVVYLFMVASQLSIFVSNSHFLVNKKLITFWSGNMIMLF